MDSAKRDNGTKAFIFSHARDALEFYLKNPFSCHYDAKNDPFVVWTKNPRVAGLLMRYATPIPFP